MEYPKNHNAYNIALKYLNDKYNGYMNTPEDRGIDHSTKLMVEHYHLPAFDKRDLYNRIVELGLIKYGQTGFENAFKSNNVDNLLKGK